MTALYAAVCRVIAIVAHKKVMPSRDIEYLGIVPWTRVVILVHRHVRYVVGKDFNELLLNANHDAVAILPNSTDLPTRFIINRLNERVNSLHFHWRTVD